MPWRGAVALRALAGSRALFFWEGAAAEVFPDWLMGGRPVGEWRFARCESFLGCLGMLPESVRG